MALVKITFDGSSVSAKQDADINHHVTGLVPSGIIRGLGKELSFSASNNYITFDEGYVQIYGRRIYVETGTKVYVSLDSTKYGYVVITVDLAKNTAEIGVVETSSSAYPTLVQQDLCKGGTKYQMPIAKYNKTTTSLNIVSSFARTYIETPLSVASDGYAKAVDYVDSKHGFYQKYGGGFSTVTMYLTDEQFSNYKDTLFIVRLSGGLIVPVPASGASGLSSISVTYYYMSNLHTLILDVSDSSKALIFTCGSSAHLIKNIYAYR